MMDVRSKKADGCRCGRLFFNAEAGNGKHFVHGMQEDAAWTDLTRYRSE